jgi:hypothetical protein
MLRVIDFNTINDFVILDTDDYIRLEFTDDDELVPSFNLTLQSEGTYVDYKLPNLEDLLNKEFELNDHGFEDVTFRFNEFITYNETDKRFSFYFKPLLDPSFTITLHCSYRFRLLLGIYDDPYPFVVPAGNTMVASSTAVFGNYKNKLFLSSFIENTQGITLNNKTVSRSIAYTVNEFIHPSTYIHT